MSEEYVMTWRCYTHDVDVPARHECPECRADEAAESRRRVVEQQEEAREERWREEERQRERHEELVRLRERETYKRSNPGDFECPHCKFTSLRREASRCPLCHREITSNYWIALQAREQAEAQAAVAKRQAETQAAAEREAAKLAERRAADDAAVAVVKLADGICRKRKRLKAAALARSAERRPKRKWPFSLLSSHDGAVPDSDSAAESFCGYRLSDARVPPSKGAWSLQPVLTLCGGAEHRFSTPDEYIAALHQLDERHVSERDNFQRVLNQYEGMRASHWIWPTAPESQCRLDELARWEEENVQEAIAMAFSLDEAAIEAITSPMGECKKRRQAGIEKPTSEFCGWKLSSWNWSGAQWKPQPVITLCGDRQFRFPRPQDYVAALLQIRAVFSDKDAFRSCISALYLVSI